MEREEGIVVIGRAEIDTRAPFRSVKEAVMLFGERVLAGDISNKLKEMQISSRTENGQQQQSRFGAVTAELEETKQSLEKAKEESNMMAYCLKSLKDELQQTKRELQQLKHSREYNSQKVDYSSAAPNPEIEELKFVENTSKIETQRREDQEGGYLDDHDQFQKKRSVKFASPPSLAQVIINEDVGTHKPHPPKTKSKRKHLIPLIGGLFSKKKPSQEAESSPRDHRGRHA